MPHPVNDLQGQKFGRLLVVGPSSKRASNGSAFWLVRCDCGTVTEVNGPRLRHGDVTSCGCTHGKLQDSHYKWNGVGELSGSFWSRISLGAKYRNLEFDISKEYAWNLYLSQGRKCALSGEPIWFRSKKNSADGTASLDRIDSSKGYVPGNVQWVHKIINVAKQNLSDTAYVEWCRKVVRTADDKNAP